MRPLHITERKADVWDECTLCAAGELVDVATNGAIRVTREDMREYCGVRDRLGMSDPTNLNHAAQAISILAPEVDFRTNERLQWRDVMALMKRGAAFVVQGSNAVRTARQRRWDPDYTGGHAVVYMLGSEPGTVWEDDPLAPAGWKGEDIPEADARRFAESYHRDDGSLFVAYVLPPEDGVIGQFTPAVGLCDLPGKAKLIAENRRDNWQMGAAGGNNVLTLGVTKDGYRIVVVKHGGVVQQALTKQAKNVRPLSPDSAELQARIDAAIAALQG